MQSLNYLAYIFPQNENIISVIKYKVVLKYLAEVGW